MTTKLILAQAQASILLHTQMTTLHSNRILKLVTILSHCSIIRSTTPSLPLSFPIYLTTFIQIAQLPKLAVHHMMRHPLFPNWSWKRQSQRNLQLFHPHHHYVVLYNILTLHYLFKVKVSMKHKFTPSWGTSNPSVLLFIDSRTCACPSRPPSCVTTQWTKICYNGFLCWKTNATNSRIVMAYKHIEWTTYPTQLVTTPQASKLLVKVNTRYQTHLTSSTHNRQPSRTLPPMSPHCLTPS